MIKKIFKVSKVGKISQLIEINASKLFFIAAKNSETGSTIPNNEVLKIKYQILIDSNDNNDPIAVDNVVIEFDANTQKSAVSINYPLTSFYIKPVVIYTKAGSYRATNDCTNIALYLNIQ